MFDPQPRKKLIHIEETGLPPVKQCDIHRCPLKTYEDGTYACVKCSAQMAVKNLGIATGFYPRMKATISSIEADVIDAMFKDNAAKKGITVELLFSMLLSEYAQRYALTIEQVIEQICSAKSAIMIVPPLS